jgi:cobalt-zinc-cadmium efflux system outer membrane protein
MSFALEFCMMRRTKKILLLSLLLPLSAQAEPNFSLSQLETLALSSNRSVQAARDNVAIARAGVDTASAFPNPELEFLSGQIKSRNPGGNLGDSRSTTLTQPLDLPWKRLPRVAAAEAALQASDAGRRSFEAETLARVRLRYFEVLRREADLRNSQEDRSLMEKVRERIQLRVDTGEAPRFELIKADAEMLNAQKIAQAAAFRLEQARFLLRQTIGPDLPVKFTLEGRLGDVPTISPLEQVRTNVRENNPELGKTRAEMVRAERQLALEKAQRLPELALKASVTSDPDVKTHSFGVVFSLPLWDRRKGPVGEAAARLSQARHELEAQEFSLSQQLDVAYQQYEIAQTQVAALESGIVHQTEAALKIAEAAYKFGERGFLEVLDAQRVHRAARAELISARFELAAAWTEIERLRAAPQGKAE